MCPVRNSFSTVCHWKSRIYSGKRGRIFHISYSFEYSVVIHSKERNDVVLPNGTTVKAKDVTDPTTSGVIFLREILLPVLTSTEAFFKHQKLKGCRVEDVAEVVVHFTPLEIVEEPEYQEWVRNFGSATSHIYINERNSCMGSESVHKIQYKLNHLYPPSFPILKDIRFIVNNNEYEEPSSLFKKRKVEPEEQVETEKYILNNMSDQFLSFTCLTYHIRPLNRFDRSKRIEINPSEYIKECYSVEDFSTSYCEAVKKVEKSKLSFSTHLKETFPYFLFLGTGSCIPNKTRNTSGIAVFINSKSTMLFDCGEGTYGQLVRHLGDASTAKFLLSLSVIFISHKHADHHIGLIRILLARKKALENAGLRVSKLILLAPTNILYYLKSYSKYFEPICDIFILFSNELFTKEKKNFELEEKIKILKSFGIESFETCFVHHCSFAYGMTVTVENGFKITYSGDTMPCQSLVNIGRNRKIYFKLLKKCLNCDILIHEATMEDDLKEDAKAKRHSTTSEAIGIGNQMNAKYIILTHFSQRYAKVPLLDVVPENVIIAFDNMVFKSGKGESPLNVTPGEALWEGISIEEENLVFGLKIKVGRI
ncbi:Ribonuclease Z, mitochondrial [Armadillidium vulgare]|nr:Ribonuclease Z, mitochondrial [Armadillidium vulgare]